MKAIRKKSKKKQTKKKRTHLEMEIENNISLGINSREYHYGVTPSLKINYKIEFINDLETNNLSYTNIIHKPDTALINKSL